MGLADFHAVTRAHAPTVTGFLSTGGNTAFCDTILRRTVQGQPARLESLTYVLPASGQDSGGTAQPQQGAVNLLMQLQVSCNQNNIFLRTGQTAQAQITAQLRRVLAQTNTTVRAQAGELERAVKSGRLSDNQFRQALAQLERELKKNGTDAARKPWDTSDSLTKNPAPAGTSSPQLSIRNAANRFAHDPWGTASPGSIHGAQNTALYRAFAGQEKTPALADRKAAPVRVPAPWETGRERFHISDSTRGQALSSQPITGRHLPAPPPEALLFAERTERPASAAVSAEKAERSASAAASAEKAERPASAAVSGEKAERPASAAVSAGKTERPASAAVSAEKAERPVSSAASAEKAERFANLAMPVEEAERSTNAAVPPVNGERQENPPVLRGAPDTAQRFAVSEPWNHSQAAFALKARAFRQSFPAFRESSMGGFGDFLYAARDSQGQQPAFRPSVWGVFPNFVRSRQKMSLVSGIWEANTNGNVFASGNGESGGHSSYILRAEKLPVRDAFVFHEIRARTGWDEESNFRVRRLPHGQSVFSRISAAIGADRLSPHLDGLLRPSKDRQPAVHTQENPALQREYVSPAVSAREARPESPRPLYRQSGAKPFRMREIRAFLSGLSGREPWRGISYSPARPNSNSVSRRRIYRRNASADSYGESPTVREPAAFGRTRPIPFRTQPMIFRIFDTARRWDKESAVYALPVFLGRGVPPLWNPPHSGSARAETEHAGLPFPGLRLASGGVLEKAGYTGFPLQRAQLLSGLRPDGGLWADDGFRAKAGYAGQPLPGLRLTSDGVLEKTGYMGFPLQRAQLLSGLRPDGGLWADSGWRLNDGLRAEAGYAGQPFPGLWLTSGVALEKTGYTGFPLQRGRLLSGSRPDGSLWADSGLRAQAGYAGQSLPGLRLASDGVLEKTGYMGFPLQHGRLLSGSRPDGSLWADDGFRAQAGYAGLPLPGLRLASGGVLEKTGYMGLPLQRARLSGRSQTGIRYTRALGGESRKPSESPAFGGGESTASDFIRAARTGTSAFLQNPGGDSPLIVRWLWWMFGQNRGILGGARALSSSVRENAFPDGRAALRLPEKIYRTPFSFVPLIPAAFSPVLRPEQTSVPYGADESRALFRSVFVTSGGRRQTVRRAGRAFPAHGIFPKRQGGQRGLFPRGEPEIFRAERILPGQEAAWNLLSSGFLYRFPLLFAPTGAPAAQTRNGGRRAAGQNRALYPQWTAVPPDVRFGAYPVEMGRRDTAARDGDFASYAPEHFLPAVNRWPQMAAVPLLFSVPRGSDFVSHRAEANPAATAAQDAAGRPQLFLPAVSGYGNMPQMPLSGIFPLTVHARAPGALSFPAHSPVPGMFPRTAHSRILSHTAHPIPRRAYPERRGAEKGAPGQKGASAFGSPYSGLPARANLPQIMLSGERTARESYGQGFSRPLWYEQMGAAAAGFYTWKPLTALRRPFLAAQSRAYPIAKPPALPRFPRTGASPALAVPAAIPQPEHPAQELAHYAAPLEPVEKTLSRTPDSPAADGAPRRAARIVYRSGAPRAASAPPQDGQQSEGEAVLRAQSAAPEQVQAMNRAFSYSAPAQPKPSVPEQTASSPPVRLEDAINYNRLTEELLVRMERRLRAERRKFGL